MDKVNVRECSSERPSEVECLLTSGEVKNLKEELDRERKLRIRALADFDNYRNRIERNHGEAERNGKRAVLLALLEVMDDFDRALEHVEQSPGAVREGLRAIHKRLSETLKAQGVTPIQSVGQEFDPSLHEAIGAIKAGASRSGIVLEPGAVTDETRRGYIWNGEVLRPARVHVAK